MHVIDILVYIVDMKPSQPQIRKEELMELAVSYGRLFKCGFCMHPHTEWARRQFWDMPFYHHNQACLELKRRGGVVAQRCIQFDAKYVHSYATNVPGLFFKRCHWGVVELVMPLRSHGTLAATLFAGPFQSAPETSLPGQVCASPIPSPDAGTALASLPLLDAETAKAMLLFGRLLGERFNQFLEQESTMAAPEPKPPRQRLLDFMDANFCSPTFCLDDLATFLGVSREHSCRLFRKICGQGFAELLLEKRLAAVAKLIADTESSVKTIASISGFASPEYLHRVFRRHFGVTPKEYRTRNARRSPQTISTTEHTEGT